MSVNSLGSVDSKLRLQSELTHALGAQALRVASDTGYLAAVVSLTALDRLERGDVEEAKRLLADNIATYCKSDVPDAYPTRKAHFREHAEKLSARSLVLKERLSKSSP